MKRSALLLAALLPTVTIAVAQKTTVKETDENFSQALETDDWIYNDLEKGFAEAKATGKPIMVVYRCIP